MASREEARQLVEEITRKHGYIRPEVLNRMSEADRREVLGAMRMKDELIESSVTTLSRNLYTSNARCVFELLQNADDNSYKKVARLDREPYVVFRVYNDRVVVECNEDGFTPENLTAICSIGKSSKKGGQVYIGEKGIGFKSVFMAAHKVSIRSGNFSFYFQHKRGDSGMGMITPIWDGHNGSSTTSPLTRITLDLHNAGSPEKVRRDREQLYQQFREIHDAMLLFLKNIKIIKILFYEDDSDVATSTTTYSIQREPASRVIIKKVIIENSRRREIVRTFHIVKQMATGLSKNENRKYTEEEERSRTYSTSEVVLAFPLNPDSTPLEDNQWIFAFLPVRQVGFKFLIQADFVTQANRQDVVTTSQRNLGLLSAIADAFIAGILQLCKHPTLQYQWMRYLPSSADYRDGFWNTLASLIEQKTKNSQVMRVVGRSGFWRIQNSRTCRDYELGPSGTHMFPELPLCKYTNLEYHQDDLKTLRQLGLRHASFDEMLAAVKCDLESPLSQLRESQDQLWHSRAAQMLSAMCTSQSELRALRAVRILPLRGGKWTSLAPGTPDVYHPLTSTMCLEVPRGLGLSIIDPKAAENQERKALFDRLGVKSASVTMIQKLILDKHADQSKLIPDHVVRHLKFLYLTHHLQTRVYAYEDICVLDGRKKITRPWITDCYIQNTDPYGASELLKVTNPEDYEGASSPEFRVTFLNFRYFRDEPDRPTAESLSWKEWLYHFVHIRRYPRLISRSGTELSDFYQHIATHRCEKLLDFLRIAWELESGSIKEESFASIVEKIGSSEVPCGGGTTKVSLEPISSAYLPTKSLQDLCRRYMPPEDYFPFLILESAPTHDTFPPEWEALGKVLGLGLDGDEVGFLLDIEVWMTPNFERVVDLWCALQLQVLKSATPEEVRKRIRKEIAVLMIPKKCASGYDLKNASLCVWESPTELTLKASLARLYEKHVESFKINRLYLAEFFTHTLEIPNCTWKDIVNEIKHFKRLGLTDFDRITELYNCLSGMNLIAITAEEMRREFENDTLVCGFESESTAWYKPSKCLWSSATQIPGMLTLNGLYENLQSFFVDTLRVAKLTAEMVYKKLTSHQLLPDEAKQTLITFNAFLAIDRFSFDPKKVLDNNVFPVRGPDGIVNMYKGSQGFALADRGPLAADFADQAKFLDFTLEEIRALRPFIHWARLQDRLLSEAVKEVSSVDASSTQPVSQPDRDIKRKSYALLRIAATYNSPRTRHDLQGFYNLLKAAETLETDQISSELWLDQDGRKLRVIKDVSSLHIHETAGLLKIYVPKDRRRQEVCFNSKLPFRLCEWMMTDPVTQHSDKVTTEAENVMQSVLSVKAIALADILEEKGVISVNLPNEEASDEDEDEEVHQADSIMPTAARRDVGTTDTEPIDVGTGITPTETSDSGFQQDQTVEIERSLVAAQSRYERGTPVRTVNLSEPTPPTAHPSFGSEYLSLLRRVVGLARRTVIPSRDRGVFDMSDLQSTLPNEESRASIQVSASTKLERDRMVGAAGELFAFELLLHVDPSLPDFDITNWQSTIRHYVREHQEYSDLTTWNGAETADITYSDTRSVLTRLLIGRGYLDESWADAKPKYFIEVKTTTAECETPFFMSKYQYRRMQTFSSSATGAQRRNVYLIIRIFYLGRSEMGFRLLMDPEAMRREGSLEFTGESWSVICAN